MCKNIFLANLLGSQYLFELLQTSLIVRNSENVVESRCFDGKQQLFFEMKEEYKVPCVKLLKFWNIFKRSVFI